MEYQESESVDHIRLRLRLQFTPSDSDSRIPSNFSSDSRLHYLTPDSRIPSDSDSLFLPHYYTRMYKSDCWCLIQYANMLHTFFKSILHVLNIYVYDWQKSPSSRNYCWRKHSRHTVGWYYKDSNKRRGRNNSREWIFFQNVITVGGGITVGAVKSSR